MQCADCHNRQGHSFEQPEEAVDGAMAAGQIPAGLRSRTRLRSKFSKRLTPTKTKSRPRSPPSIGKNIPASRETRRRHHKRRKNAAVPLSTQCVPGPRREVGHIPNNLGHADNGGCFRCHDESHATPQKKTISQDCSLCHNPLAVEETSPAVLKTLGLDQKLSSLLKQ